MRAAVSTILDTLGFVSEVLVNPLTLAAHNTYNILRFHTFKSCENCLVGAMFLTG